MADPKFVRLATWHASSQIADVRGSGWCIGGAQVKPFPNNDLEPDAVQYVRGLIRNAIAEEASEEEYNEQVETDRVLSNTHLGREVTREDSDNAFVQEGHVEDVIKKAQRRIAQHRGGVSPEVLRTTRPDYLSEQEAEESQENEDKKDGNTETSKQYAGGKAVKR